MHVGKIIMETQTLSLKSGEAKTSPAAVVSMVLSPQISRFLLNHEIEPGLNV